MIAVCAACGGDPDIDAPDDCAADELHLVHGGIDERLPITNHAFVNKLSDISPGTLDLGTAMMGVHIEFDALAAHGDIVDARGSVTFTNLDVGNCDFEGFPGYLHVEDGAWRFELLDLKAPPYCGGMPIADPLGGCYRAE